MTIHTMNPHSRSARSRKPNRIGYRPAASSRLLPAGWPAEVKPPSEPEWEASASAWLFDQCPHDYRGYPVFRRHTLVLARCAAAFVESQIQASAETLSTIRVDLRERVPLGVTDEAIAAIEAEHARLVRVRRGVALIEHCLAGGVFVPKL